MDTKVKLERITLREVELQLVEPFQTSGGVRDSRRVLLVKAEDADGVRAWSECVAFEDPGYLPETIVSARHVITRFIAPLVLGCEFNHPEDLCGLLNRTIRGNQMAKAAVEMAAWAIAAEKNGRSLSQFIGGVRPAVAAGVAIGLQPSIESLMDRVQAAMAEGYHRVKLKIAPGHDVAVAQAACEMAGASRVMLDANCAYTLANLDTFRAMDGLGLMMIEQPLGWDDLVSHAALQRELQTPLCLDESLSGLDRVTDMATLGSGKIVSLKPGRVGGFAESLAIHTFCTERDIPLWCGGMLETGIGRAYNVALASLPGFTLPGDLSPSRRYWREDLVEPAWEMGPDGMVEVPRAVPGLGVAVNEERIDQLSENHEEFRANPV